MQIADDWIAIGAPGVEGLRDVFCIGGGNTGALYVFNRTRGSWGLQQVVPAEEVRQASLSCVSQFGRDVVMSGKWIVSNGIGAGEAYDVYQPMILTRQSGHYTLTGATDTRPILAVLRLAGRTLFVGVPFDLGCQFEACFGTVNLYNLDEATPSKR